MLRPLEEWGTVTGKESKESNNIHSVQRHGVSPGTGNGAAKLWLTA